MKKIKETEEGKKYEWIDTGHGSGFWSIIENEEIQKLRTPISCPACEGVLFNWDTSYYNRYGICSNCYIDHIEGRENIEDFGSNFEARVAYVREKIAEKSKRQ